MHGLRSLALGLLLVVTAVLLLPATAMADTAVAGTADQPATPAPAAQLETKLAGGVSLLGLGGLVVFGLRRLGARGDAGA